MKLTHKCKNCGKVQEHVPKTVKVAIKVDGRVQVVDKKVFPPEFVLPPHKCQKRRSNPRVYHNPALDSILAAAQ